MQKHKIRHSLKIVYRKLRNIYSLSEGTINELIKDFNEQVLCNITEQQNIVVLSI